MTAIPPAASAAVADVLMRDNWSMRDVLEAAAPHIAAAERERIIQLASQLRAAIPADHPKGAQASFADYLRVSAPGRCCDLHGRNCEPYELCCDTCTEADHPAHRQLGPCSSPVLSPNTLAEAAKINAAVTAERDRIRRLATEREAWYHKGRGAYRHPFADLLDAP